MQSVGQYTEETVGYDDPYLAQNTLILRPGPSQVIESSMLSGPLQTFPLESEQVYLDV